MSSNKLSALREDRKVTANTARELAALDGMSVGQLAERYHAEYGVPTRTRNIDYLRKRLAWRIQERAEGGLSPRALDYIEQLADKAPVRWREPVMPRPRKQIRTGTSTLDPRLPPLGSILARRYDGVDHQVTVLKDGFAYKNERHRSLSTIARLITGTAWNGFVFFGLARTGGKES